MQAVDNREARLRSAFQCIETEDGRLRREDIIRLLTVRLYSLREGFKNYSYYFWWNFPRTPDPPSPPLLVETSMIF